MFLSELKLNLKVKLWKWTELLLPSSFNKGWVCAIFLTVQNHHMIPKREFLLICKYAFKFKLACHSRFIPRIYIIKIISRGSNHTHRFHHRRGWAVCFDLDTGIGVLVRECLTYHLTTNLINHLLLWRLNSILLLRLPISINRAVCTRLYYNNSQINRFADKQAAIKV